MDLRIFSVEIVCIDSDRHSQTAFLRDLSDSFHDSVFKIKMMILKFYEEAVSSEKLEHPVYI